MAITRTRVADDTWVFTSELYVEVNAGQVLPSERLIETLWGYTDKGGHQLLRTTMERLRKKIEPTPHQPQYIVTIRDIGYQFVAK